MTHILLNECHIAWNGMRDAAALHRWHRGTFTYVLPHVRSTPVLLGVLAVSLPAPSLPCLLRPSLPDLPQAKRLLSKSRFNAKLDARFGCLKY